MSDDIKRLSVNTEERRQLVRFLDKEIELPDLIALIPPSRKVLRRGECFTEVEGEDGKPIMYVWNEIDRYNGRLEAELRGEIPEPIFPEITARNRPLTDQQERALKLDLAGKTELSMVAAIRANSSSKFTDDVARAISDDIQRNLSRVFFKQLPRPWLRKHKGSR